MFSRFPSRLAACVFGFARLAVFFAAATTLFAGGDTAASAPASAASPPEKKENFRIYLLMGQSNMAGRDTRLMDEQPENPRVLSLSPHGQWVIARDPLHPKTAKPDSGVGPGLSFGNAMAAADPGVTIGLVPCAVGGTQLRRWVKGGDLYEQALARAKIAAESGVLCGMLWHQGESDSRQRNDADTYQTRLAQMFADLRQDLGRPDLPIAVGQLGEFLEKEHFPRNETVRAAIARIPSVVTRVAFVDSTGLVDKGDHLHFSSESARELGKRYAAAMTSLQRPSTAELWPSDRMPGHGAVAPEAPKPAQPDGVLRLTNVSTPTLTFFPAPPSVSPAPAMIVCPGGGYRHLAFEKEGTEVAAWLNTQGISAFVLKYRVPDNRDGAAQDVQRAIRLARANASAWGLDPHRLGVVGFSAGGHLAATASTRFGRPAYAAIDEADTQSARPDFAVLVYPAYLGQAGVVSADLDLSADIPPTLIVHSEDDKKYVPGSKLYDAALTAHKISHRFLLYPTGGHGYGLCSKGAASAWPDEAATWLDAALQTLAH